MGAALERPTVLFRGEYIQPLGGDMAPLEWLVLIGGAIGAAALVTRVTKAKELAKRLAAAGVVALIFGPVLGLFAGGGFPRPNARIRYGFDEQEFGSPKCQS